MATDSSLLRTPPRRNHRSTMNSASHHRHPYTTSSSGTPSMYLTPSKTIARHHHTSKTISGSATRSARRGSSRTAMPIPRMSPIPDRCRSGNGAHQYQYSTPSKRVMDSGGGKTPYYTPSSSLRQYTNGTPSSASSNIADDRYIPSRRRMNMDLCRRALLTGDKKKRPRGAGDDDDDEEEEETRNNNSEETPLQKAFKRRMLSSLCNVPLENLSEDGQPTGLFSFGATSSSGHHGSNSTTSHHQQENINSIIARSTTAARLENPYAHDTLRSVLQQVGQEGDPASQSSTVSKKIHRKVLSAPTRILDAPDIVNDYYLQLISWGKDNILAVALAQSVYLWNATSGEIQHLFSTETPEDYVTSVDWCTQPGRTKWIAIGTNANVIHIYDAEASRKVRTMEGHSGRVCSLAWSHQWLTSGGRDSLILQHDIRSHDNIVSKYEGHEQEVCGLKWNEEGSTLASGGNENYLCLWDASMSGRSSFHQRNNRRASSSDSVAPRLILTQHKAAVKALDWCPFHRGLLASGGGTADRTIKFWNSSSGAMLNSIDTGSQVCSVLWSKHQREICSSHGYSENQLILWKYPTMTKIKELTGHTERVLNMDMSPDGATVVSAAADETLRFWNVFGAPSCRPSPTGLSMSGELSFGMPTIR